MVFRKIAVFAVGSVGSAVLGLVTLPIITWFYSAEDVGRIAMLQVASNFCVLLFCLGLDQAYVREYHEEKNRSALLKACLFPGLLCLLLSCSFVFFYDASILAELMYEKNDVLLAYLTILCFIFALVSRFLSLILRMQERALAFSLTQILPKILFLLVIASFITFSVPASFGSLLIAQAISMFAIMSFFAWNTRGEWRPWNDYVLHKARFYELLRFGLPLVIGGVAAWGLYVMDRLFLRAFSSFAELGLYSVAASIAAGAGILGTIFTTIWSPTVFKWAAEGVDEKKIDEVSEHVLACVFYIFVISGLFSWMVPIFLPEMYAPIQYMITVCIASPLLYALSETTAIGISISRRTGLAMLSSILAALTSFCGNYLLVPLYGAAGAAVATAVAFWFFLFCRTEFSCLVWRQIPRFKLYMITSFCTLTSSWILLSEEKNQGIILIFWTLLGLQGLFLFRKSIGLLLSVLLSFYRKQKTC
ncbi:MULTISPECIES: lipopolysaccharide biosynthesis protein [Pseudomonas aeruginosa group]|uniref:lipopolysaccharide biosynthesis protein n=1 Tax=Pseudomonas aeruginosa group TaxID=136841 RepID=UPI0006B26539|nr:MULTISPECIES: oligosaccharide flippase family protein [Pseudomonas aeruginosa group]KPD31151.1 polysaccharide biosynthesis protein [Pseudomonas paraeruginosa]KQB31410.1 polysaccharide biosynthesis protein [Pseudomonas paraeruginosa]MDT1027633.1 oligosaccharide flippase family protein [Pseudomonas paraeruginosa]PHJ32320.1 polysaccharide biosynthesis protein [Pseudomonas paraeruginosa]QQV50443.1 oligosaccharide flippase family protein [Pseudomonas aeruginosa]